MRHIILDTETTGLDPSQGHRIIEIAAVEMVNRQLTGNHFHCYLNPDREIDTGAQQVHGISLEFLQDKPRFADVVQEFLTFVRSGQLIIHNAPFDVGFLNHELAMIQHEVLGTYCDGVIDTLRLAKELHPGQKNNLDALCRRYGVDNSNRTLHGALLDAELLAEVYLALTRGQESLLIDMSLPAPALSNVADSLLNLSLRVVLASDEELAEHQILLSEIDKESQEGCLWRAAVAH